MSKRADHDFYRTPIWAVEEFLTAFLQYEPQVRGISALDPCAGGDASHQMPYPNVLAAHGWPSTSIQTIDIRPDSLASLKADYLKFKPEIPPGLIITNPPFSLALQFIEKALYDVADKGCVVMLLRTTFFGSRRRLPFWRLHPPKYCFVHSRRMSFTDDNKTDSSEYMHVVWQAGVRSDFIKTQILG